MGSIDWLVRFDIIFENNFLKSITLNNVRWWDYIPEKSGFDEISEEHILKVVAIGSNLIC